MRFHDGSAFDAAAAKFSLDRALAPESVNPQKSRLAKIRAVEIVDPYTLRILLAQRSGGLLQSLAWGAFVMVSPRSAADQCGATRSARVRFDFSVGAAATRSPWCAMRTTGAGPRSWTQATFKFIADPTAAYAALMAGDVDAFANYPAPESFAQFAADPRFAVFAGTTEMETVLALNDRVPPLDDLLVRRAISYALDRRAIIDGAMFGYGTPIGSHFPPHNPAYVDLTGVYPHDVAKAKALLAQAGYAHGFSRHAEAAAAELCAARRRDRRRRTRRRSASTCASRIWNGRSGWIRYSPGMTST